MDSLSYTHHTNDKIPDMKNQQATTIAQSSQVQKEEMVQMMMMSFLPVILMVIKLVIVTI